MSDCVKCGLANPLVEFYTSPQLARAGVCKSCHRAAVSAWQRANPKAVKAKTERWTNKHPEAVAAYQAKKAAKATRDALLSGRGMSRDGTTKWLTSARKRAGRKGVPFELLSTQDVCGMRGGTCPCCGGPHANEMDRIVPQLGYVVGNCAWLCAQCNRRKQDNTIGQPSDDSSIR